MADWWRRFHGWPVPAAALLVTLAAAALSAAWLAPVPFSDWAYYWHAAADPSAYERGGALMLVLGLLQPAGLSPAWTALVFNLPFVAALLWCMHRLDRSRHRLFVLSAAAGIVLLAPYLVVVQLDLSASIVLGLALVLLMAAPGESARATLARSAAALVLVAVACSTRPQFVLVLPVFAALWWGVVVLSTRGLPDARVNRIALVLVAGAAAGFALDSGLRAHADRSDAVRYSSGVTLYAGLFAAEVGPGCGRWSPEATRMARADMDRPVHEAAIGRLAEHPPGHWGRVIACKVPDIVFPGGFAMGWVLASPNVSEQLAREPDSRSTWLAWRINWALDRGWRVFVVLAYGLAVVLAVGRRDLPAWRWVPFAWLLAFWAVHLVFEIQERYFLGTVLLVPVLVALAWRQPAADPARRRFDQG